MTKATQEELPLRDPRKRPKPLQMELPFNDRKGRKARRALGRHLGVELKSFKGQYGSTEGTRCTVIAHDSGEAKALLWRAVQDAGFSHATFTKLRISRGEHDWLAKKIGKGVYSPEAIADSIKKHAKLKKQHGKA